MHHITLNNFNVTFFVGSVVRQRVVNFMRVKFKTVEEAESFYGLTVEMYLNDVPPRASSEPSLKLDEVLGSSISSLAQQQLEELITKAMAAVRDKKSILLKILMTTQLSGDALKELINLMYQKLELNEKIKVVDKQFVDAAISQGIDSNPADFASISLGAMKLLQENGKPNLIYKWAKCVFGENGKPLIPIDRMPFGLLQYQMEFFTATNVMQVIIVLFFLVKGWLLRNYVFLSLSGVYNVTNQTVFETFLHLTGNNY